MTALHPDARGTSAWKTLGLAFCLLLAVLAVPMWRELPAAGLSSSPWEDDGVAHGSLRFYDARGGLLTSGRVAATPFAGFVQSSTDGGADDHLASLHAFTPRQDAPASEWVGEVLSGPTTYPSPRAPTSVNGTVLPVVTGRAGDQSLASYIAKRPNPTGTGSYAGVYQLRMYTSGSGSDDAATYAATYIAVDGETWTQLHPDRDSTTVSLAVSPRPWTPGVRSVALVAKLTPATVGGTVNFYDGSTLLRSLPGRAIQASLDGVELSPGAHMLTARFSPETEPFQGSAASVPYEVGVGATQATMTTLTVNPQGPVEEGSTVTLTARVDPTTAPGSVDFLDGPHLMATVPLSSAAAAYATTALKPSTHQLGATYRPSSAGYQTSTAERVDIKVVKRKTPPADDEQVIRVRVRRNPRVLGTKQTRRGVLGVTGAPLIVLMVLGGAAVVVGIVMIAKRRHERPSHASS